MRRISCLLILASACSTTTADETAGGIAVALEFGGTGASGSLTRGLRAAGVPMSVARLEILAVDGDDNTLAETNLYAEPAEGQTELILAGGTWQLNDVTAGRGRSVIARAYLGASADPMRNLAVAFEGRLDGIEVRPGSITEVGPLKLEVVGPRLPELDFEAPDPPRMVQATATAAGGAIDVRFAAPPQDDAVGWLVAVGTSSAVSTTPALVRGEVYAVGDRLGASVVIAAAGEFGADASSATVRGLTNGVTYSVLVYAYDTDLDALPLNYSQSAAALAVPADTLGPEAPRMLSITASTADSVAIQFLAPEDERPIAYEVRTSEDALLLDPLSFSEQRFVAPPDAGPVAIRFARTFSELGTTSTTSFFIGVRGYDTAGNAGRITIAERPGAGDGAPRIDGLSPTVAMARSDLTIRGTSLGSAAGRLELITTGTSANAIELEVRRWSNHEVVAHLPSTARSGVLTAFRADGAQAQAYLPVVTRLTTPLIRRCFPYTCSRDDDVRAPYEIVGAGAADGSTTLAVYRECCTDGFTGGVERVFGLRHELFEYAPHARPQRSTAIAGMYSADTDSIAFLASSAMDTMSTAKVSALEAPAPVRLPTSVAAGGADRVALTALTPAANAPNPAMVAFTIGGVVRTSTVRNVEREVFNAFYAIRSSELAYDRVTMARGSEGTLLMAHRSTDDMGRAVIEMRENTGADPSGFTPVGAAVAPTVADNLALVATPPGAATPFVLAYEAVEPDGRVVVRLVDRRGFGRRSGIAPVPLGADQRLEDLGVLMREGAPWIVVAISEAREVETVALIYTELPLSDVVDESPEDGRWPGVALDVAQRPARARLGCKPMAQNTCPVGWLGPDVNQLFIRR